MFANHQPAQAPHVAAIHPPALAESYGSQVAREIPLIESVLFRVASEQKIELAEGDLDTFCRLRHEKLSKNSQQKADEKFEPVRLLNMLYEGCLSFLKEGAAAFEREDFSVGEERIGRALKILSNLLSTLNPAASLDIATNLARLYEFSSTHLAEAQSEHSVEKVAAAHGVIEKIYLGYLELEIANDAARMLKETREQFARAV